MGLGVLSDGDLVRTPTLTPESWRRTEAGGRKRFVSHPDLKSIIRKRTSVTTDFWPKSRMGKALPGEAKVRREKYSGTSQLILLKS